MRTLVLVTAVMLAACAAPRPDQATIAASQRTYHNVTADQVLDAAAEVIRLADPEDTRVERYPGMVRAERTWFIVSFLSYQEGREAWLVSVQQQVDDSVRAQAELTNDLIGADPAPATWPATYDTLWQRVDYLLGLTPTWRECPEGGSFFLHQDVPGLCGPFVEDLSPTQSSGER